MSDYQDMINRATETPSSTDTAETSASAVGTTTEEATPPVAESTPAETTTTTETTTTPVAETTPEAVETTEVKTPAAEKSAETPPETTTPFNYDDYVSPEQLKELKAEWQEQNNKQTKTFFDERSEKIDNHLRNGGELDKNFWKYQTNDLDSIDLSKSTANDAIELVKQELTDVQGYSEAEAELTIKRKYPDLYRGVEEGEEDERATERYDDDIIQVGMDARRSLESLKDYKAKVVIPTVQSNEPSQADIDKQRDALNQYKASAEKALDEFTKIDLQVSEDVSLEVLADSEFMGTMKELIVNPDKLDTYFFDNYVKDGNVDHKSMVRDLYISKNWEALLKSAVSQGITMGKEEALKETGKEPSLTSKAVVSATTESTAGNDWLNQVRTN